MYDPRSIRRYQEADVGSMSKEKMIILLYEKMITCYEQAERALQNQDRIAMSERVTLAQRIVTELRNALDHAVGGEVARNLESLYDFVFHQNLEVLVDLDPEHLRNCVRVLAPLLEAWRQIPPGTAERAAREQSAAPSPGGPEPAPDDPDGAVAPTSDADATDPADRTLLSVSA
jgi:flagellar protein FliS